MKLLATIFISIIVLSGIIALLVHRSTVTVPAAPQTIAQNSAATNLPPTPAVTQPPAKAPEKPTPAPTTTDKFTLPIDLASNRLSKKPFGLYVSPGNSPVSPEHFTGYHTGADFETFAPEANTDVVIEAICDGPLLLKKAAQGYGGVAVQSCRYHDQPITIIYGHLRLTSITTTPNTALHAGETIGVLGTGYTSETAGERKHLHLGIHRGSTIELKGYVQNHADLAQWLDPKIVLSI